MRGKLHLLGSLALLVGLACAPSSCACNETKSGGTTAKPPAGDAGTGTGPTVTPSKACDDLRPSIEALYRAATDPKDKAADQAIADNTRMVLVDCYANPTKHPPCIKSAKDVAGLERDCLVPLDDEGRVEGDAFRVR